MARAVDSRVETLARLVREGLEQFPAEVRDRVSSEQTGQHTENQHQWNYQKNRQLPECQRNGGHSTKKTRQVAYREIDMADDYDQGHADSQNGNIPHLVQ